MSCEFMDVRVFIACDKFKGSLEAQSVNEAIASGMRSKLGQVDMVCVAMADGGEGTLEFLKKNVSGKIIEAETCDPLGSPIQTLYFEDENGVVYIESAKICGLGLLDLEERNPMETSSYGIGFLLRELLSKGKTKVHLFLGGSATNDGGMGLLSGLGFRFVDDKGLEFRPTGGNLIQIKTIIPPMMSNLKELELTLWTDVDNVLLGDSGATFMYSRQKGAKECDLAWLESGIKHVVSLVERQAETINYVDVPGVGAAGGIPFGCLAFLRANLGSATSFLFEVGNLNQKLALFDVIITGEGSMDAQSVHGKVVQPLVSLAKKHKKRCYAVVGQNKLSQEIWKNMGIHEVFSVSDLQPDLEEAMENAPKYLESIGERIAENMLEHFK